LLCKAKPPVEGLPVVDEQMHLAHVYFNKLIEIHREFWLARLEAKRRHIPGLAEAETEWLAAKEAGKELAARIKQANAAARRKRSTPEDMAAAAAVRLAKRLAGQRFRELRAQAAHNAGYQAELGRLIVEYHGELPACPSSQSRRQGGKLKEARRDCGLYPGTYLRVENAVEQAVKMAKGLPQFRRWSGDGLVGPQLTKPGLTTRELLAAGDSRLRLQILPGPTAARRSQRVLFWIRVRSDGRAPVWAKVPAHLSRGQLPDDAVISWASLARRQVGIRRHADPQVPRGVYRPYYEWSVQLTLRTRVGKPRGEHGRCGLNLGYRLRPNGELQLQPDGSLRVASWADDAGQAGFLALPARLLSRWSKVYELQSLRAQHFNAAKEALAAWLATQSVPDWLREKTALLLNWQSMRRLGGVQGQWARERFAGDEVGFALLTTWRERDVHLEQYELNVARRARRWRLALFRKWVAELRGRYRNLAVDNTCQAQLNRLPKAESNETVNATARQNARIGAPGLLRSLLVQAGADLIDPENITMLCHACGSLEIFDHAAELAHCCTGCQRDWDQDTNAAINVLARAQELARGQGDARDPEVSAEEGDADEQPPSGGRWARRKANRSRGREEDQEG
jgi:hypothetical protein